LLYVHSENHVISCCHVFWAQSRDFFKKWPPPPRCAAGDASGCRDAAYCP
jgi:hypothetical protein